MNVAVEVINFIRSRANNYRLFHLAKEMGTQHVGLLFYAKVRWLSRDKCLFRLYELKNEIEIFLRINKNNLRVQFHNEEFVVMLAYLANVFGHLNDMNLSLQGRDVIVSDVRQTGWANCSNGSLANTNQSRAHYLVSFVGKTPENE